MNITVTRAVIAALAAVAVAPVGQVVATTIAPKAAAIIGGGNYTDITSVPSTNILYISGSTAIDPMLKYWGIDTGDTSRLCAAGTATLYAQTATPKFTAVACTASSAFTASGISVGSLVAFVKEDAAGSLNGILPLQNKSVPGATYTTDGKQDFPIYTQMAYSGSASASSGATCYGTTKSGTGLDTYLNLTCASVPSVKLVPQLGYSDVEAAVFGVNPTGLNTGNTVDLVFGVATNVGFYRALQVAQGKTTDDTLANMPSLTATELAAIFNGNLYDPSLQLIGTNTSGVTSAPASAAVTWGYASGKCFNGTANTTTLTNAPCTAAVTSDAANIYICRRGDTSGSEKAAEIFFDNQGCAFNTAAFIAPATLNTTTICSSGTTTDGCAWASAYQTGVNVFTGGGTGDLLDCLVGQDNAGHFAIGFASVDNLSGSQNAKTTRNDFRYIRINGVIPSIEAAAAGKYPFIAESVYYYPTTQVNAPGAVASSLLSLMTGTAQGVGTAGSVAAINAALINTTQGFNAGALVIPKTGGATPNSVTATNATFAANPVSTVVKNAGTATNNCIRPQAFLSTNAIGSGGNYAWVPAGN